MSCGWLRYQERHPWSWCGFPRWWTSLGKVPNIKYRIPLVCTPVVFLVNSVYVKTVQKSPVFISERSLVLDADNYEWAFPLCECPVACSKLCGRVLLWVVVGTAGHWAFQVPINKYLQCSPPTVVLTQVPHPHHFQEWPHWEPLVWKNDQEDQELGDLISVQGTLVLVWP